MRLNVISLPARADRRSQFTAWNARPGVEIVFVDAVIGSTLSRDDLVQRKLLASDATNFSPGALGNALSHHKLWTEAAATSAPILVCEDDACLRADFAAHASAALAQLPAEWDIIYFGYNTNATVAVESADGLKALMHFDESVKRTPGYFESFSVTSAPAPASLSCFQAWGTLAYAISPRGAAKLLQLCFPLNDAADIYMFGQNRKLKPYTLDGVINLALQRSPVSAHCLFPPLAVSANDLAGSDVVTR